MATLASPSAASSASSTCFGGRAASPSRRSAGRAPRASRSSAATSTMRLPYVFPSRIIEMVESVLRTSFCAVPALSRVEPARNSGPTTTAISCSTSSPSAESGDRDDAGGQRSRLARRLRARRARTACVPLALTPTTTSAGRSPSARTIVGRRLAIVLGGLLLERRGCSRAAGDERDHDPPGGSGERRLALGRVERGDQPGRAGADVDEPPAIAKPLGDRVHRRRDRTGAAAQLPRGRWRRSAFMSSTSSSVARSS